MLLLNGIALCCDINKRIFYLKKLTNKCIYSGSVRGGGFKSEVQHLQTRRLSQTTDSTAFKKGRL
jgi:hypothetical protein